MVEIPSQERPSFYSDVDLPRPASELDSTRRTRGSDLSIHECPPLVVFAVAETSVVSSNGLVSIQQTTTKGAALLSRIGSVKKWSVRRKRGDSTSPTDANGMYGSRTLFFFFDLIFFYNSESFVEREPISSVSKWDPRRMRRNSTTQLSSPWVGIRRLPCQSTRKFRTQ